MTTANAVQPGISEREGSPESALALVQREGVKGCNARGVGVCWLTPCELFSRLLTQPKQCLQRREMSSLPQHINIGHQRAGPHKRWPTAGGSQAAGDSSARAAAGTFSSFRMSICEAVKSLNMRCSESRFPAFRALRSAAKSLVRRRTRVSAAWRSTLACQVQNEI